MPSSIWAYCGSTQPSPSSPERSGHISRPEARIKRRIERGGLRKRSAIMLQDRCTRVPLTTMARIRTRCRCDWPLPLPCSLPFGREDLTVTYTLPRTMRSKWREPDRPAAIGPSRALMRFCRRWEDFEVGLFSIDRRRWSLRGKE